jgi:dihydrofolate synthase/folylpolyglutamate synthase
MTTDGVDPQWDYRRALEELWHRSNYERGLITDPFGDVDRAERGRARMRAFLAELGDPQRRVATVHVAGSKGKGSTAAFIATAAHRAGHSVGLYTSPHLHRFNERIAVDLVPLTDVEFAASTEAVARVAAHVDETAGLGTISTFELLTAMAFVTFAERGCDLAVIEVGLGGLYDATNVLEPVVAVITRIDLEHTAVLGPTYTDIALQKAGILRPGVPAVSSPQVPEAEAALIRAARETPSPLLIGGRDWSWQGTRQSFTATGPWGEWRDLAVGIPGPHQVENACTALAALNVVDEAGLAIPEAACRAGLAEARWLARFERLEIAGRQIVLDGAHTPAAARALVAAWQEATLPVPVTVVLGMGSDKTPLAVLTELRPLLGRLIATRAESPRAADPATIAAAADALGIAVDVRPSVAEALRAAESSRDQPLLVVGSLFVAAEAREALGLAEPDLIWRELNAEYLAKPAHARHEQPIGSPGSRAVVR